MIGYTPVEEDIRARSGTDDKPPQLPGERQRYIDGLRVLAAILEGNPGVRLPSSEITIHFLDSDSDSSREAMAEAARAFPCSWGKRFYGSDENAYFDLAGQIGGLQIRLAAYRDAVCRRVVAGTEDREVDEVVTPAVTRKVTRPVEVVKWDCGSLLAPRPLAGAAAKAVEAA
jgi:hypothetical protein